jgi:hypothetical protein|eukprot:COSAG01_NODE_18951_length_1041_cov_2.385350_2_plen_192_part_00
MMIAEPTDRHRPVVRKSSTIAGLGQARLLEAAERGDVNAVETELFHGTPVDAVGESRWTALHRAADRGWLGAPTGSAPHTTRAVPALCGRSFYACTARGNNNGGGRRRLPRAHPCTCGREQAHGKGAGYSAAPGCSPRAQRARAVRRKPGPGYRLPVRASFLEEEWASKPPQCGHFNCWAATEGALGAGTC